MQRAVHSSSGSVCLLVAFLAFTLSACSLANSGSICILVAVLVFTSKSLLIIRYEQDHCHVDEFFITLDEEF